MEVIVHRLRLESRMWLDEPARTVVRFGEGTRGLSGVPLKGPQALDV